jgi:hypothetical protein
VHRMGIGISNNVGCVNNVSSSFLGGLVTIPTYQEVASAGGHLPVLAESILGL